MQLNFLTCTQVKRLTYSIVHSSFKHMHVDMFHWKLSKYILFYLFIYFFFSDLEPEIIQDLCFDGMFVYTLLTAGLGFNNDTFSKVVFSDEVSIVIQLKFARLYDLL